MPRPELENEWSVLQNQFDSYEKYSLIIKLFSIGLLSIGCFLEQVSLLLVLILLVVWVQDAIWKTYQSRIGVRLHQLEQGLRDETAGLDDAVFSHVWAYQFNSDFIENRPAVPVLIREYVKQALRPTVAFPHGVVVLLALIVLLVS